MIEGFIDQLEAMEELHVGRCISDETLCKETVLRACYG